MAMTSDRSKPRYLAQRSSACPLEQPALRRSTIHKLRASYCVRSKVNSAAKSQARSCSCALHQPNWAAEHGLDGILGRRFLDWADVFDKGRVFLHPALDDAIEMLAVLADNGAHALAVEGEHHVIAELPHIPAQLAGRFLRQEVLMKQFASRRARHCPVRADEPQIKSQRLGDGHGEHVPAPGSKHDLDSGFMRPPQRIQVGRGDLDFGIQQRAININGDEANGALHDLILTAIRRRFVGLHCGSRAGTCDITPRNIYKVSVADRAEGCRIANTSKWIMVSAAAAPFDYRLPPLSRVPCRSPRRVRPEAHEFAILHGGLWEATMQYRRWLATVLFSILIPHAHAQRGGTIGDGGL